MPLVSSLCVSTCFNQNKVGCGLAENKQPCISAVQIPNSLHFGRLSGVFSVANRETVLLSSSCPVILVQILVNIIINMYSV